MLAGQTGFDDVSFDLVSVQYHSLKAGHDYGQYVRDAENAYLESHDWDDYAQWHLGLTHGASDGTKARYAFVYGDFRRIHRSGLIACVYRASQWRHKAVELAAHDLLQYLDTAAGIAA